MAAIPQVLRVRTLGMPRWVWLAGIGGGVIIGIYLRTRRRDDEATADETLSETGGAESPLYGSTSLPPSAGGGVGGYDGYVAPDSTYQANIDSMWQMSREILDIYRDAFERGQGSVIQAPVPTVGEILDGIMPYIQQPAPPVVTGGGPPDMPVHQTPQVAAPPKQQPSKSQQQQQAEKQRQEAIIQARVDAAMATPTHKKFKRSRAQITESARRHPNWGPHTLAKGGRLEGHSEAF